MTYDAGCIYSIEASCSFLNLTSTDVGLTTIDMDLDYASIDYGHALPMCNSAYTAQLKKAVKDSKVIAAASRFPCP